MPNQTPVAAATPDSSSNAYVRLHVSPLDAELLPVVLNSTLLPKARNVSFHTLETFPEKRYGFVELPKEDAEKVRKKFNGAVLRGAKMKVDPAKPDKNPAPLGEEVALADEKSSKKSKKSRDSSSSLGEKKSSKKRKRDNAEEITGVVLPEGRQVKRGWTSADEPKKERKDKRDKKGDKKEKKDKKDKKKQRVKSKYTEHDECLVKTVLPPNKVANTEGMEGMVKKKKKKDSKREVVVHEFAKTTKFPTFLKAAATSGSKKAPSHFDEEKKCWVDEDGNVVEEVKATRKPTTGLLMLDAEPQPEDDSSSSSEDEGETRIIKLYHESSSESEEEDDEEEKKKKKEDQKEDEDGDESDSESEEKSADEEETESAPEPTKEESASDAESSDSSDDEDASSPSDKKESTPPPTEKAASSSKVTSSPGKNLSIRIPPPATPATKTEVHPLEALYKKPKDGGEAAEAQPTTGFSFFGGNNDDFEEEEEEVTTTATRTTSLQVPLTPYTEKDFESRGLRSAAPTPDTAHPSRRFKPWEDDNEDIQEEDEDEDKDMVDAAAATGAAETGADGEKPTSTSDFQKWFWEHRGDLNRSWKKRRKLVGKEKRYRENRARMARAI